MAAFALDSSCMVAAVCAWHEHHDAARARVEDRLERGDTLAVAAHAVAEAYAVLTRLPAPHRLAPADAWALVSVNFVEPAVVVTLDADGYRGVLSGLAAAGIGGGRTYDALIAKCASQAGVESLLTLNPRHFDPPPPGVRIVDPRSREEISAFSPRVGGSLETRSQRRAPAGRAGHPDSTRAPGTAPPRAR